MDDKFDAIIVGAGPAGCTAAYLLAKEGLEVLLVERGNYAGSKNMTGGVLYGPVLSRVFPDFPLNIPLERPISRHVLTFLSASSAVSLDANAAGTEIHNGYSILRAKFDRWFAKQVEDAGGIVATGLLAEDLVMVDNRVTGIVAGGDEMGAEVVIAADGVNSLMAQKAGLGVRLAPHNVNQGVKEVIKLPPEVIEDRFNVAPGEGAAVHYLGIGTEGVHGGGFLYTNKESISVGVVVQLKALMEHNLRAIDLLESFKGHPAVKPLIKSGTTVEYSAHLVPAGGRDMMPRLCTDGMLVAGDAGAMVLATGRALEGINYAMASGMAAAETVKQARQKGDYSRQSLVQYEAMLADSFVFKDLENFRSAAGFLDNPRLYRAYPDLVCGLANKIFEVDGQPKKKVWQVVRGELKGRVSLWQLIKDGLAARKSV